MTNAFIASVPLLRTERLNLREYRREDFDAFAAHCADPVSSAHIGPADRQAAWRIFCSHAGLWLIHGAGWWAVGEKESGRLVGSVGAHARPAAEAGSGGKRLGGQADDQA
ncbi:GNAT family N-acetyltransferase [Massilia sp. BKSP1R2A-1]|uniref:GNAT family N-acetyltransferase n=1 Tax=Massilia sp. BKSP1R2A-1 TaxID=3422595 RepID=UPI003D32FEF2